MHEREPPSTPASAAKVKVLYVMGAGRSGSTILGATLGNCDGVFFAGELDKWLARSGVPQLTDDRRVEFWAQVRARVSDASDLFGYAAQRCLERSSAVFRVRDWRRRSALRGPYRRVSQAVYEAVASVARTQVIVDTSHYPLRAAELQELDGAELYLLFLVRDPRSVVASFSRRDVVERGFDVLTTNMYLWLTHALSVRVFLRHPRARRLFVRHEDFVADPDAVLRQILSLVGSDAPSPDLQKLRTGIAFQGNRLLCAETIALNREPERPNAPSRITTILQLPWRPVFARLQPASQRRPG
jgi:Sulfotransferase family